MITDEATLKKELAAMTSTKAGLAAFFEKLPDETHYYFELSLTRLVERDGNIEEKLQAILSEPKKYSEAVLYATFYALYIYHRRNKNVSQLELHLNTYKKQFGTRPLYQHMFAALLHLKGRDEDIQQALFKAKMAAQNIPDNPGVLINFADITATAFENNIFDDDAMLKEAEKAVNKAIVINPDYAKYYCILGRIVALKGNFIQAQQLIRQAIDMEDQEKTDYAIRIGDYQNYLSKITFRHHSNELSVKLANNQKVLAKMQQDVTEMIQETRTKNLEFLGFFAGLVSFTIGGIQILNNQPFDLAVQLLIALGGVLLCSFGGFSLILHGKKSLSRSLGVFILGLVMVAIGIVAIPFIVPL